MKRIYYILLMLSGILMLSCARDNDIASEDEVVEGVPTAINIRINDVSSESEYMISQKEEISIKSVQVLIFNSNRRIITNKYFPIIDMAVGIPTINTYSGNGINIYVVANPTAIGVNYENVFDYVTTIEDLANIKAYNVNDDVATNKLLMMSGFASGVTIPASPKSVTIPIKLDYVASKVQVNMINMTPADESVNWTNWTLKNQSKVSYIYPKLSATDAANPANASDYIAQSASKEWQDTSFNVDGMMYPGKYTVFYLFENRRGGRVANASTPPAGYTPGSISANDPKDKSWYAPPKATSFVATGIYYKNSITKGIQANIYIGANNYNDYNVERLKYYTYNVKVKGINEIDIDSRVDYSTSFSVDILNPMLDCHYDWRPLRITSKGGTFTIEILDENGLALSSPASFWLKVSTINLNKFLIPGRVTYNPATDMKTKMTDFVFTDLNNVQSKMLYLYADEYIVEGVIRKAKIRITSSQSPSDPVYVDISQKGYQSLGNNVGLRTISSAGVLQPNSSYQFVIENIEESRLTLTPGSNSEATSTMQWGFYGTTVLPMITIVYTFYCRDGYYNTQNIVMSNTTTGETRLTYGRGGNFNITDVAINPIYNISAARYCFEKNRDLNGDGKIMGSEVKWYLPSTDESVLIYIANNSMNRSQNEDAMTGSYYASTEGPGFPNLAVVVAYGTGMIANLDKTQEYNVRCIRKI